MQTERRQNRSDCPDVALSLALAAAARRSGARAAVISDADGLLIAGAGADVDLEHVAAYAPLVGRRGAAMLGHEVSAAPIQVGGAALYFAALGGPLGDVGAMEAAARRIFA